MKRNFCSRFAAYAVLAIVAGWSAGGRAQSAGSRIAGSVFDGRSSIIEHSQSPLAIANNDAGPAAADVSLNRMLLLLEPSGAQASAVEVFLRELQDRDSPNYHRWLTPQQFGERFGVSSTEIQAIISWLQSQGFTVGEVARGGQWIEFSGTAAQVEIAFHAPVHRYVTNQGTFFANAAPVQVPAALAGVVAGLVSLSGPEARSAHTPPIPMIEAANAGTSGNAIAVSRQTRPLTPQDFASIYNLKPLYAAGFNGAGESIAIVTRSNVRVSDVASFREAFALPENAPQVVLNGEDPGLNSDEAEAVLDTSWAGAVAPNAAIQVVASKSTSATDGVDLSIAYAVDHAVARVISTSYVACESQLTTVHNRFYEAAWKQAAAEGITVAVAAGDSGAAACEMPEQETPVSSGFAVNGIASTRYNTAVGGTSFGPRGSVSETNASLAESSYIDEQAWSEGAGGFHAGGGGVSSVYASPEWQAGVNAPEKQGLRSLPDLSLAAAAQDDSFAGYSVFYQDGGSRSGLVHYAGTSASTAAFAGMMAIVDQYTHSAQGNANPHLYGLARMGGVFHDVKQGSQQLPCKSGSPGCIGSGRGSIGYAAGDAYDLATGLGSVDANAMATHWSAVPNVGSNPVTLTVTPSSATPTYGSPFTATATLAYTGATAPTGTVTFTFDGVSQGTAPVSTTAGTATATLAVPTPTVGSHNLAASYGGDANFAAASTQSVSVVVSKGTSVLAITATPAILTAGTPETFTAVLSSGTTAQNATFTGNIQFFDGTTPLGTPVAVTMNQAVSSAMTLDATVPHAITAVYYGDGNWSGTTSPQLTLKATSVSAVVSLQVSSPVVLAGSIVTFTATIAGNSANPGVLPTGTVIFYDGGNPIGQSNVVSNLGVATATLFTSILPAGVHNVTAAYQGDSNFKAATSSAVSVAIENYSIFPNVTTLTLSRGQSAGVIYTLASGGGLNATIQFSCAPPPGTQMTCSFNPSTLSGSGQTVLTVTTTAGPTGMLDPRWLAGTGSALACLVLLACPLGMRGQRLLLDRKTRLMIAALLICGIGSMVGCGNSISANPNSPSPSIGTPLGVQTLTITTATTVNGLTTTQRSYLSVDVQ